VLDHDSVTLPGLGRFVTEIVPASFTDRGYTILPPYRRLFFSPKQGDDTLLVDIYRKSNPDASEADATRILVEFLQEMKEVLKVRKTIIFPGLGRLRATKENNFFFVADEDLDIYPAGFGLQPISLKTHEETPEETEAAVAGLANILEAQPEEMPDHVGHDEVEPEPEPVDVAPDVVQDFEPAPEPEPVIPSEAEESPEPEEMPDQVGHDEVEPEPEPEPVKKSNWLKIALWVILGLIVLAVLALVILGRVCPHWLDQFLYSPEELEILYPGKL
ncbi:MAG: hypothetical protein IK113_02880, partial [Bacteroidales bacterium]|nr:hypothetical protein [Bacteroidales bacterium]